MPYNSTLKAALQAAITTPAKPKISGTILQQQLLAMLNAIEAGAVFMGAATPATSPTGEANCFYFALTQGTYTNFLNSSGNAITLADQEVAFICSVYVGNNLRWEKKTVLSAKQSVVDVLTAADLQLTDPQKLQAQANLNNTISSQDGKMGYKVLQPQDDKDLEHTSFDNQIKGHTNTIFEIRDAYDLDSANVTIPSGCILKFNGGMLSNGNLVGNETFIDNPSNVKICERVSLTGTFTNEKFNALWFGANRNDNQNDATQIINFLKGANVDIYFPAGNYYLSAFHYINTKQQRLCIVGEKGDGLSPKTIFYPYEQSQPYIIKIGGEVDGFGANTGEYPSHRGYNVTILDIVFRTPDGYDPGIISTTHYESTPTYGYAALILDVVEIGHFAISGSGMKNMPLLQIGYAYECTFDYIIAYNFKGKSDLPIIQIVNDQSHGISATLVNLLSVEDFTGPVIYSPTFSATSESIVIDNVFVESTINNGVTTSSLPVDYSFSDYTVIPLFKLSGYIRLKIGQISITNLNNNLWQNTSDDIVANDIRGLFEVNTALAQIIVNNITADNRLCFNGSDAGTTYYSTVFIGYSNRDFDYIGNKYVVIQENKSKQTAIRKDFDYKQNALYAISNTESVVSKGKVAIPVGIVNQDSFYLNQRNMSDVTESFIFNENLNIDTNDNILYLETETMRTTSANFNIRLFYYDDSDQLISSEDVQHTSNSTIRHEIHKITIPSTCKKINMAYVIANGKGCYIYKIRFSTNEGVGYSHVGSSTKRPNSANLADGFLYYDRTLNKFICVSGGDWKNIDGSSLV